MQLPKNNFARFSMTFAFFSPSKPLKKNVVYETTVTFAINVDCTVLIHLYVLKVRNFSKRLRWQKTVENF